MTSLDFKSLPKHQRRTFGRNFLDAVLAYYADPDNLRRYQAWEASRRKEVTPDV